VNQLVTSTNQTLNISIQPAVLHELSGLRALIHTIFLETEGYVEPALAVQFANFSTEILSEKLTKDPVSVLIARLDGAAVGFAILTDQNASIWLDWYGVRASVRGKGMCWLNVRNAMPRNCLAPC
jgi:hypothetical protein